MKHLKTAHNILKAKAFSHYELLSIVVLTSLISSIIRAV